MSILPSQSTSPSLFIVLWHMQPCRKHVLISRNLGVLTLPLSSACLCGNAILEVCKFTIAKEGYFLSRACLRWVLWWIPLNLRPPLQLQRRNLASKALSLVQCTLLLPSLLEQDCRSMLMMCPTCICSIIQITVLRADFFTSWQVRRCQCLYRVKHHLHRSARLTADVGQCPVPSKPQACMCI